jgi:hypothetical protein
MASFQQQLLWTTMKNGRRLFRKLKRLPETNAANQESNIYINEPTFCFLFICNEVCEGLADV